MCACVNLERKLVATFVALVTFSLPMLTYSLLLLYTDPLFGDSNPVLSAYSCGALFGIVFLVFALTHGLLCCLVKKVDQSLEKLRINIYFALSASVAFQLIVLHLRNGPSISEHFFRFRLPTETYLFAVYIVLSRFRYFLQALVNVNNDRLFEEWEEEYRKKKKKTGCKCSNFNLCHSLLYLLPRVEFLLEVIFLPGLKHLAVLKLGSSGDHASALMRLLNYACVGHQVEVEGGFSLVGVPIYITLALGHLALVLGLALLGKATSNWFIVLTVLEGLLVLSVQILLLNPISFFVTIIVWFYMKPYRKMSSKDDISKEELMLSGCSVKSELSVTDSSKKFTVSCGQNFRYLKFDDIADF